jgi:hypothetical protein
MSRILAFAALISVGLAQAVIAGPMIYGSVGPGIAFYAGDDARESASPWGSGRAIDGSVFWRTPWGTQDLGLEIGVNIGLRNMPYDSDKYAMLSGGDLQIENYSFDIRIVRANTGTPEPRQFLYADVGIGRYDVEVEEIQDPTSYGRSAFGESRNGYSLSVGGIYGIQARIGFGAELKLMATAKGEGLDYGSYYDTSEAFSFIEVRGLLVFFL